MLTVVTRNHYVLAILNAKILQFLSVLWHPENIRVELVLHSEGCLGWLDHEHDDFVETNLWLGVNESLLHLLLTDVATDKDSMSVFDAEFLAYLLHLVYCDLDWIQIVTGYSLSLDLASKLGKSSLVFVVLVNWYLWTASIEID